MNALELSTEDFRRLAADVVDLCAGYLPTLDERSTFPQTTGAESERLFDLDLPERGMGDQAFAALTDVIAKLARSERPLFRIRSRIGRANCRARRSLCVNSEPEHYGLAVFASRRHHRAHCRSLAVRSSRLPWFRRDADQRRLRR